MATIRDHDPNSMASWTRKYLVVAAIHYGVIGITILVWPEMYQSSPVFIPLRVYTYLTIWGVCFCIVSLVNALGAVTERGSIARLGMLLASVLCVMVGFAVGWGVVETWREWDDYPPPASPLVPIGFFAFAAKDLLIMGHPLRKLFHDDDA